MADYKALVIDYEPRGIRQLREPLEAAGFEVHVAQDGEAGRKAFDRLKPDVAVIEAMLPKRHGFDLCADLKKTPHGAKTPIVIVTSVYRGRKYRNQAIHQYGCDEFMEKPVDAERLLATVRQLVDRARVAQGRAPEPAQVPPPVPSPASAWTAAPVTAPQHDDPEDEISRRLDELLGGGGDASGKPRASMIDERSLEPARNLVQFDLDRVRRTPDRSATTNVLPSAPDASASYRDAASGGGARQAHAHAILPREAARPAHTLEPALGQGRLQRPLPNLRRNAPVPPASRRLRLLVILLVVTVALALLSSLL